MYHKGIWPTYIPSTKHLQIHSPTPPTSPVNMSDPSTIIPSTSTIPSNVTDLEQVKMFHMMFEAMHLAGFIAPQSSIAATLIPKVKLPELFSGLHKECVDEWLFAMDAYFHAVLLTNDYQHATITQSLLSKEAAIWHQSMTML